MATRRKRRTHRRTTPLNPAGRIVKRLGGPKLVSRAIGISYTAPYRWMKPRDHGGTGGMIPARHFLPLLRYAAKVRVPLKAADFLPAG